MPKNPYIKSPLNYTGGKHRLLPQIMPLFPHNMEERTFVDLFCGGLNVGVNVDSSHVIANDNIDYLIELFQYFQQHDSHEIVSAIRDVISEYGLTKTNKDGYDSLRKSYNKNKAPLKLLVLIFYSFNHQIRFNNDHEFNCSFGANRSSYNPSIEKNLIRFVDEIHSKDIEFQCGDFIEFPYEILASNDFVYCDPPYLITTGSYNDGNRGFKNWTMKEQQELFDILDELNDRGVLFAMSNVLASGSREDDSLRRWSSKYIVHHLDCSYSNASYHKKDRSGADEVLIANYEKEA